MIGPNPLEWEAFQENPGQDYQGEGEMSDHRKTLEAALVSWPAYSPAEALRPAIRALLDLSERRRVELKEEAGKPLRLAEENERLKADLEVAEIAKSKYIKGIVARIEAALALHVPVKWYTSEDGDRHETTDEWCSCGHCLPCPTVKALRGEERRRNELHC
jgi:hypothetical protein